MQYDLDLWADDLAALLDALDIDRAHVMQALRCPPKRGSSTRTKSSKSY